MRIFLLFCLLAFFISCSPKPAESGDLNRIRMDESDEVYIMTKNIQTGEENKILLNRNRGNTFIFGFENGSEDDTSIPEFQQVLNARVGAGHERKGGAKNQHVVKTGVIEITEHDSKERYATRLQFEYQNPKHPQLQYLYKKEKLAELKQDSEFETLIHVLNWTRQQWEPGSPEIYPPWNANVILSSIRAGQTSGFCAQYSQVLVQTLTAMGHQARYLWLTEHFGVEVFSNELNQWLIIDPLYNCVIKQGDKFLNAYDVFTALQSEDKGAGLFIYNTLTKSEIRGDLRTKILHNYSRFVIDLKNTQVEEKKPGMSYITEFWKHSAMWAHPFNLEYEFTSGPAIATPWLQDLYFKINQSSVEILEVNEAFIGIDFTTNTPYHAYFEISADNGKTYERTKGPLKIGVNVNGLSFMVRSVNVMGVAGPSARFAYTFTPKK